MLVGWQSPCQLSLAAAVRCLYQSWLPAPSALCRLLTFLHMLSGHILLQAAA